MTAGWAGWGDWPVVLATGQKVAPTVPMGGDGMLQWQTSTSKGLLPIWLHPFLEHNQNYPRNVAMLLVATTHLWSFMWLLLFRSSYGIFYAFGSSIVLEAALLWIFFSNSNTPDRIMIQTLGLALAGTLLFIRTIADHWWATIRDKQRSRGVEMERMGGGCSRACVSRAGGARKEAMRIKGAEGWLIAWSISSWAALLYAVPCMFALLRQGVDPVLATFSCHLLFFTLAAQIWVFASSSTDRGAPASEQLGPEDKVSEGRGRESSHARTARGHNTTRRTLEVMQHVAVAFGGAGHYYGVHNWVFACLPVAIGVFLLDKKSATSHSILVRALTRHSKTVPPRSFARNTFNSRA